MAIVVFCVVGILTMLLIYFVLRAQTLQNELTQARSSAKATARKTGAAFTHLALLTQELQKVYGQRLDAANTNSLLTTAHYDIANVVIRHFSHVVMECCEKGRNVEEALAGAIKSEQISLYDIKRFIENQSGEVRLHWQKNAPTGFITACSNLTRAGLASGFSDTEVAETKA